MGLGMVMQVLVLAGLNAVYYQHLGAATSGIILFRCIDGSVGVPLFGAIFANLAEMPGCDDLSGDFRRVRPLRL